MYELLEEQIKQLALPAEKPEYGDDATKEDYLSQYKTALKAIIQYLRDYPVSKKSTEQVKALFDLLNQFNDVADTLQKKLHDYFSLGTHCGYFDDAEYTVASLEIRGLIKRIQLYAVKLRAMSGVAELQPEDGLGKLIAATQCDDGLQLLSKGLCSPTV